jgi:hypothetical protein
MGSLDLVIPKRDATTLLLRGKRSLAAEALRNDQRYPLALLVLGGWPTFDPS